MLKYQLIFLLLFLCGLRVELFAQSQSTNLLSEKKKALTYLSTIHFSKNSYWPKINPQLFKENLYRNIEQPVFLYAGRNTNFCGFAALGYVFLKEDPLGYTKFMTDLYLYGKAEYASTTFTPSKAIMQMAGQVMFEGELDRNDADQVLFFTLADHFKGYLNIFNRKYHPGDEQGFWAATNLRKFNRMLRVMFHTEIKSTGSDLIRPSISNLSSFLHEKLQAGDVFLYINNTILRKKNHYKLRKRIPTHYIVLLGISEENGVSTLTYWDTGSKTRRLITTEALSKILYGVSWSIRK